MSKVPEMSLIGLELNDCGIMAAGGQPARLLELDGNATESPGFALPHKDRLLVGKEAERKAHLFPRQTLSRFWDQLNTDPLEQSGSQVPQNHAAVAYRHLTQIWEHLRKAGDEIVVAVPSFFAREQLGLLLGIAQEVSMPVKGFVPTSLAVASTAYPGKMLFYLDIHLHRLEINYLNQADHLSIAAAETSVATGLTYLYQQWIDLIAREFVRSTRFDPYHRAASEQELHDRLPAVLSALHHHSSLAFEMIGGSRTYRVSLTRDRFVESAATVYAEIRAIIERWRAESGKNAPAVVLQLTQRLIRLPGCQELLSQIRDAEIVTLDQGAGAYGALKNWAQLSEQHHPDGIVFFTRRPWHRDQVKPAATAVAAPPTHLLYGSIAYPISANPLYIGSDIGPAATGIQIQEQTTGVSGRHCALQRYGREVVLNDFSTSGTFVDEARVNGRVVVKLGQKIRVGPPGVILQLIACLDRDAT
jgi:hypothetical protein